MALSLAATLILALFTPFVMSFDSHCCDERNLMKQGCMITDLTVDPELSAPGGRNWLRVWRSDRSIFKVKLSQVNLAPSYSSEIKDNDQKSTMGMNGTKKFVYNKVLFQVSTYGVRPIVYDAASIPYECSDPENEIWSPILMVPSC